MKRWSVMGTALFAVGSLAGGALAVGPSKADTEFCNQKAAQTTKPSPVQPSTTNQAAMPPAPGTQSEASKPGTPVSPGPAVQPAPPTPQQGYNPSRTDSSPSLGTPPSAGPGPGVGGANAELGMAPIGKSDPVYRQAYIACITDRQK